MLTFTTSLVILLVGAIVYGRVVERVMKLTDAKTPATEKYDGVDFVPMKRRKNSLIELLNIAGTGPILGPIQGILFGPIAFITIPIGCVIGGAFYDMMILEGFIAMVWAAAAMGAVNLGLATNDMLHDQATSVVGIVAKDMLGSIGGIIAIIGVIVLPITSGDTALRSLRIMISDAFNIDTTKKRNNLILALMIFTIVAAILVWAKADTSGFNVLWRYFSWANECTAVFTFAMVTVYMINHKKPYLMALLQGMFYMYIVSAYILNAQIGFNLPWEATYIVSAVLTLGYAAALMIYGRKSGQRTLRSA